MTKTLLLRGRIFIDNVPQWHDAYMVINALERIVEGKTFSKTGIWMKLASEIELAKEEYDGDFDVDLPDIEIEVRNSVSRLLWKELRIIKPEAFGRRRNMTEHGFINIIDFVPSLGTLYFMLEDIAECLEEDIADCLRVDDEDED